jgi:hypothetical protein
LLFFVFNVVQKYCYFLLNDSKKPTKIKPEWIAGVFILN